MQSPDMPIEPLPPTGISKILGLCEVLDDHGGKENIYRLSQDLHMALAELLLVLKAAHTLGLIRTPDDDAVLTELGKHAITDSLSEKKALLRQQMLKLSLFQAVVSLLERKDGELPADVLVEQLALLLPQEQPREVFTTILNWGRYGEIFGYSRETDHFYLQKRP